MAISASEATVRLGSEGGAETAREINQTAGAMSELGAATKQMTADFSTTPNMSGWSDVGKQMAFTATEVGRFSGGMVGLSKSIEEARVELGGFGLALELVPGLTLVEAATGAWTAREEALTRHLVEKNNELRATIELFGKAEQAGINLSASQEDLAKRSADMSEEVRKEYLERAKGNLEKMKERGALSWLQEMQYRQFLQYGQSKAAAELLSEATREYKLELAKTTAEVEALEKGHANLTEEMTAATNALVLQQRALQGIRDEHRQSREALEMVDPAARYEIDLEQIERVRQARLASMSARVTSEEEHAEAVVLINATAANKSALAWERETQQIAAANKSAASSAQSSWSGMESVVQGLSTNIATSLAGGSVDAANMFQQMAQQMIAQMIQMAVQAMITGAAMRMITGGAATPVISAAGMFHHGGMVPAPRGQAVNITAHGGERVVSDTGRGAPMGGEGGGTTNKYYFQTGILTPDSQRTMIRQVSRTQRGTGEKSFPQ